ncbi:hypothetical protein VNO77_08800 [Canavalia gladiata]|uniref:Uncharacterized protein n=1 Tax=Canavalia gladiata TaxID=3824 RepID=A0AAN9M8Q7_CANGL
MHWLEPPPNEAEYAWFLHVFPVLLVFTCIQSTHEDDLRGCESPVLRSDRKFIYKPAKDLMIHGSDHLISACSNATGPDILLGFLLLLASINRGPITMYNHPLEDLTQRLMGECRIPHPRLDTIHETFSAGYLVNFPGKPNHTIHA